MLQKLTFTFVVLCWDVQCRAFKRFERSSLVISTIREKGLHVHTRERYLQIFSIRGGGDDDEKSELDGNAAYLEFITSFESELAEIRREAEMEANYEMEMLLGLFQHEDEAKPEESALATCNVNERTSEPVDQLKLERDENILEDGEIIYQPVIESDSAVKTDDTKLRDVGTKLDDRICQISDLTSESEDSATVASEISDTRIVDSTTIIKTKIKPKGGMKQKALKRKAKASKKRKKHEERTIFCEDLESSGVEGHVDYRDSIMLPRVKINDVAPTKQSCILAFIRSDLGRALGLFIATVLLAIITTRLQRQMEEAVSDQTITAK